MSFPAVRTLRVLSLGSALSVGGTDVYLRSGSAISYPCWGQRSVYLSHGLHYVYRRLLERCHWPGVCRATRADRCLLPMYYAWFNNKMLNVSLVALLPIKGAKGIVSLNQASSGLRPACTGRNDKEYISTSSTLHGHKCR